MQQALSITPFIIQHTKRLASSFQRLVGRPLFENSSAEAIYHAPFVLVSHGTEADPVLNYANLAAQKLWKLAWEEITKLPSRYTAEPVAREERQRLLDRVTQYGYIDDYSGIRIASDGTRFRIQNAIVWNISDEQGRPAGQAAMFNQWGPV